mmetsp:Transcript_13139/g.38932  ORF Transcript_13139/g.38932 Transcript_13139/m.38932 type:complete len:398 (-) Transcript_13139:797-1990(-)
MQEEVLHVDHVGHLLRPVFIQPVTRAGAPAVGQLVAEIHLDVALVARKQVFDAHAHVAKGDLTAREPQRQAAQRLAQLRDAAQPQRRLARVLLELLQRGAPLGRRRRRQAAGVHPVQAHVNLAGEAFAELRRAERAHRRAAQLGVGEKEGARDGAVARARQRRRVLAVVWLRHQVLEREDPLAEQLVAADGRVDAHVQHGGRVRDTQQHLGVEDPLPARPLRPADQRADGGQQSHAARAHDAKRLGAAPAQAADRADAQAQEVWQRRRRLSAAAAARPGGERRAHLSLRNLAGECVDVELALVQLEEELDALDPSLLEVDRHGLKPARAQQLAQPPQVDREQKVERARRHKVAVRAVEGGRVGEGEVLDVEAEAEARRPQLQPRREVDGAEGQRVAE